MRISQKTTFVSVEKKTLTSFKLKVVNLQNKKEINEKTREKLF